MSAPTGSADADKETADADSDTGSDLAKEEKLTELVESILETNPGSSLVWARKVARATLDRYPSLVS